LNGSFRRGGDCQAALFLSLPKLRFNPYLPGNEPNHDPVDSGPQAFKFLENMYTSRSSHIASIESAGVVPTSS
jgi:hypothetical protein